ncbi:aspartyl-phosphate phosphatase Spo0E family protein [Tissierella sp. Yu-01]|uniref:aspartyl-phosphate phosphatase Spo0E family protein n=1 Tax=Tissierella sp. Yu-01 TaxID=3035694 RepID=UPI00240DC4D2|nr:aspartyl-phosphate phosphatase Spo0E family protein [Tissierella sp. Yu-01]WFA08020.1 aspartyl-phosphate phosphatase Spo0E family protein [Tissierella sp. Yu-01]
MADKDLYKEKQQKDIENDDLKIEIERIRNQLNGIVIKENNKNINKEVIEISKKLDELIVRYLLLPSKTKISKKSHKN